MIDPGADPVTYAFHGAQGQRLQFHDKGSTPYAGRWILCGPYGHVFQSGYLGTDFDVVLPDAGQYVLFLESDSDVRMSYGLQVANAGTTTLNYPLGRTETFSLAQDDQRRFVFAGTAGQQVYFDNLRTNSSCSITLTDPDGNTLFRETRDGDQGPILLPQTGTYTLTVQNSASTAQSFSLRLLDVSAAGRLAIDGPAVSGTLASGLEMALYTFHGTLGQPVQFQDQGSTAEGGAWTLYGTDGQTLNLLRLGQGLGVVLPQSGNYLLALDGNGSAPVSYQLRGFTPAPAVTGISPVSGPITGTTLVWITGTNVYDAVAVDFGTCEAMRIVSNTASQIVIYSPPCSAGVVDVSVTTTAGTSSSSADDKFTYQGAVEVTASEPSSAGPTNAAVLAFTVTFNGWVGNVDPTDFTLAKTGTANGTIAAVTPNSGTSFAVTVNSVAGDGTLRLDLAAGTDVADGGGNLVPAYSDGNAGTVDHTAPTASITQVIPDPRNTAAGIVTVLFSESVENVSIGDFRLTRNGAAVSLGVLTGTMVNDSQFSLDLSTVSAAPGAYVLTLFAGGSSIADMAGNPLAGDVSTAFAVHSWQNVENVNDVNDDSHVTPMDALAIINELNSRGPGAIFLPAGKPPFVDVNGDSFITPLDALVVINVLNQYVTMTAGGEGEVPTPVVVAPATSPARPTLGESIRVNHGLPLEAQSNFSNAVRSPRVQRGRSHLPSSVAVDISRVSKTEEQPTWVDIAGPKQPPNRTASLRVPRFQRGPLLGESERQQAHPVAFDELDDLLEILANDVAGMIDASAGQGSEASQAKWESGSGGSAATASGRS